MTTNIKLINDQIKNSFERYVKLTGYHLQTYITEEKRIYPNETKRKYGRGITGINASSPRDVVDSGATEDSYDVVTVKETEDYLEKEVHWQSEGIIYVYGGTDKQPPYPFVEIGLRGYDHSNEFRKELK